MRSFAGDQAQQQSDDRAHRNPARQPLLFANVFMGGANIRDESTVRLGILFTLYYERQRS